MRCRVPVPELLLSFKLHSARKADVKDAIMLAERVEWDKVPAFVDRGNRMKVARALSRVLEVLDDPALVSSLRASFSLKVDVEPIINNTRSHVKKVAASLTKERTPGNSPRC